jgi:hypothetical protein
LLLRARNVRRVKTVPPAVPTDADQRQRAEDYGGHGADEGKGADEGEDGRGEGEIAGAERRLTEGGGLERLLAFGTRHFLAGEGVLDLKARPTGTDERQGHEVVLSETGATRPHCSRGAAGRNRLASSRNLKPAGPHGGR